MGLRVLSVERLRNLEGQLIPLCPGLNLLCGENAQGKSNILEAVSLVCTARSFRLSPNVEMIRFGEESAAAEAELDADHGTEASPRNLRLAMDRRFKYAFVDRHKVPQMADYLAQSVPAVCFRSESLAIGRGSPEVRRQFLDQLVVSASPSFLGVLRRYHRALLQRNTALKESWSGTEMVGFEKELAATGVRILERRTRLVEELALRAAEFQKEFAEVLTVRYRSSFAKVSGAAPGGRTGPAGEGLDEARILEILKEEREKDRRQGYTRRGPHRDDLELELEGRSVRRFGSQGQVRSVVLSLKVAEIELVAAARGVRPVLILDDISADIDERRRERLFDYVAKDLQAFVSTTEGPAALGLAPQRYHRYEVRQGRVFGPA